MKTFFKVIIIILLILSQYSITFSQQYKNVDEYKKYLLKNNISNDDIEGVWEVSKTISIGFKDQDPRASNVPFPDASGTVAPYNFAIIKINDNVFRTYPVDIFGNINESNSQCGEYWFKSTSRERQYIFDNGSPCDYLHHGIAYINSNGDLIFSAKNEEVKRGVISWNNFSITAVKISPTASDIKKYKSGY